MPPKVIQVVPTKNRAAVEEIYIWFCGEENPWETDPGNMSLDDVSHIADSRRGADTR